MSQTCRLAAILAADVAGYRGRPRTRGRPDLASAYALKRETERASAQLAEARKLASDDRYSSIARLKDSQYFGVPQIRALFEATYFAGLRKAGMPEE